MEGDCAIVLWCLKLYGFLLVVVPFITFPGCSSRV